jgi:hypothetical protein
MSDIFIWLCLGVVAACIVMLIRNEFVFKARIAILNRSNWINRGHEPFDRLPEYDDMLKSPKYWLLWTTAHWEAWLDRSAALSKAGAREEQA